jgi:predicted protein tyrosine phosphatase
VHHNLFVGSQDDEVFIRGQSGWFVVHACKDPYHRQALSYTGRAAPKDHPEYLIARRPGRLILNLIDADDVNYIPAQIMDAALSDIHQNIPSSKVLIHCNKGMSRSPAIGLLYLLKFSDVFRRQDHDEDLRDFLKIYPHYAPARGVADYVRLNWTKYASRG